MNFYKYVVSFAIAVGLTACGGGGGNPGTSTASTTSTTTTTITPVSTIRLALGGGGSSISASGSTVAQATVVDANGVPVVGKLVTFTGDPLLVKFSPTSGQVLTVAGGIASIQVSPASVAAVGAGTLSVNTTVGTAALSSTFDFQLAAANLGLQSLNLGSGALPAFGNRPISVLATINGVASINTPVQVTFSASCGSVTPAVVTTDAAGTASTTYTASLPICAGTNVTVAASAVGATSVSGVIPVAASIATNVQFISTTPQLIYLAGSVGLTQSQVVFKAVDSSGNPLQNKKLRLSISNSATGVSLNTVGNTAPVDLTTDSAGLVSAAVYSGGVPTSLNLRATLLDSGNIATNVYSDSNLLTVAVGRPTQRSLSLSFGVTSIEGASVDGQTTTVTLSMADRQGNPVPENTQVNFVSESGVMQPPVCFVGKFSSSCQVVFRTQGTRTANGRVSIMAYVDGEEDFVDANGNNVYDSGEPFTDLGRAFRDDNAQAAAGANGIYDTGEFQVPRLGTKGCIATVGCAGDGVWGSADVRTQGMLVVATSGAVITTSSLVAATPVVTPTITSNALNAVTVTIGDGNGNSMPTGTVIDISAIDDGLPFPGYAIAVCNLRSTSSFTLANSLLPISFPVTLAFCAPGDKFRITVTTPVIKTVTERIFTVQ